MIRSTLVEGYPSVHLDRELGQVVGQFAVTLSDSSGLAMRSGLVGTLGVVTR
jgi:hypothetical protein